ncbi:MAG: sigma 54-interacting transcriptional regulator [Gammaproteobacteria bacterium]|nr:sigma 54-interacting transcriptional regulator [Gammaproteobacteria bacterium]
MHGAVNCSAIPENLIESELFGYRPGAFTGADTQGYKGRILEANGGTLFLDEIGDMPTPLQTRLLRVLSEGEIVPLGSSRRVHLDINIISATLQDIPKLVADGTFREDLYFRLNGAYLQLPALRERADIRNIISRILDEECNAHDTEVRISEGLLTYLERYFWQGNIRELKNALKYCIAMCDDGILDKCHLPLNMQVVGSHKAAVEESAIEEKEITLLALKRESWNVSAAARMLGLSRATLHRRMKQYGFSRSTH